jgi:hypothetical protein
LRAKRHARHGNLGAMGDAIYVDRNSSGERSEDDLDAAIARPAGRKHGRVARGHLVVLGLSDDVIDYRLARSRLHVVRRGVYAVGHDAPTREANWMAAVLAGGEGAVLSHPDAAALSRDCLAGAVCVPVLARPVGGQAQESRDSTRRVRSGVLVRYRGPRFKQRRSPPPRRARRPRGSGLRSPSSGRRARRARRHAQRRWPRRRRHPAGSSSRGRCCRRSYAPR